MSNQAVFNPGCVMSEHSLLLETPPRGWTTESFGDMCIRVQDSASPNPDGQRLYLGLENLASGFPALVGRGSESEVRSGKTAFRKGDVLFGKLRPYLRKSALVSEDGICSTDILVFRASERSLPEFLCLLTHSDEFVGHAKATTSGVQHPRTSWASLREFKLHLPPLPEQRKIAGVLGLVQRAIEQQERLIALTTELKKTLLHKLFTEGLNGEPQKQTDIGPLPQSWEGVKLEDLFDTQLGKMLSQKARIGDNPKPYLRNKNVQWGAIDTTDLFSMDFNERERGKFILVPGDLLICEGGEPGRAAIWRGALKECYYQKALHRLRPKSNIISNEFLAHWLEFAFRYQDLYGVAGASSTIAHLPEVQLKMLQIPLPSRNEQDTIVESLNAVDNKIALHQSKHAKLTILFRTLLHQFMTAQLRIDKLDSTEIEVSTFV
jgi:type I restriction enzyme S subunit